MGRSALLRRWGNGSRVGAAAHDGKGDVAELQVVIPRMLAQGGERHLHADLVPFGEHTFGLLDHDAAVERVLKLLGEDRRPVR